MDEVIRAIEEALERKGMSASAASVEAVGNPSLIKNLKNRRATSQAHPYENLKALADVLGLELYFGEPRVEARPTTQENAAAFERDYQLIRNSSVEASAGFGRFVDAVVDQEPLAFRRDWLARMGIPAKDAVLLRARGDSMEPLIWDGDLMLIDTSRKEPKVRSEGVRTRGFQDEIYVLRLGDDLRVKAVRRPHIDKVVLYSENRALYDPEILTGHELGQLAILGKVMWWGHVAT